MTKLYLPANNPINYVYDWNCFSHFIDYERIIEYFKISRFIWKHSDTYTSVTRGHFLINIYIQDMTDWTYDEK